MRRQIGRYFIFYGRHGERRLTFSVSFGRDHVDLTLEVWTLYVSLFRDTDFFEQTEWRKIRDEFRREG